MSNIWKPKMEDEILIERFLSGDEAGFTMLVKKYQERVINIIYSLSNHWQHSDDIAQEVFIKVYNGLRTFRRESEFATWLYRICVNTTYNYIKKEKRLVPEESIEQADASQRCLWRELESRERQEIIAKTLNRLPFQFRSAIVLKELEGLSYKEIAKTLGCRLGTVESRLFRARQMLKQMLSPVLKEEGKDEV